MHIIVAGQSRESDRDGGSFPADALEVAPTPSRWPVPEERRTVTVLFVDIVGSTALVDRLDPEDVRRLQHAYFDTVRGVLGRWRGVVEKYIGDAVMALFGARESDGFDTYRAVRAGLEIQRALNQRPLPGGPALRVRVGIATGEAVVDLVAARDGGHGAASGAVITLAARMQEYAPPGGVALCPATHRATRGHIAQRPVPPVTVAGKALPLQVWHAAGVCGPAPSRHPGPLIGRRRELAAAREVLLRTIRERRPHWLSLVGPVGSGRSRLLQELRRVVASVDRTPVRWCVTACPPGPEPTLAPIADQVRAFAGLRAADPAPVVRRRLTVALAATVPLGSRAEAVYALEGLLHTPDTSTDALRGAAVWQEVLLAIAHRQPVVVAVDDLDRAASEVIRFLRGLLDAATQRALPVAVVTLHTPDRADTGSDDDRHRRLPLRPLRAVEMGRLLRHRLAAADRSERLLDALLPVLAGNPGRVGAYLNALVDGVVRPSTGHPAGGATPPMRLPVPEAVRRTVDARLDRLDGAHRAVLMVVATVGTPVSARTVDQVLAWAPGGAAPVLRALVADGVLRLDRAGGHTVVDPVLRQVAYGRLTRAWRAVFIRRLFTAGHDVPPTGVPDSAVTALIPDPAVTALMPGPAVAAALVPGPVASPTGSTGGVPAERSTPNGRPVPTPPPGRSWTNAGPARGRYAVPGPVPLRTAAA